MDPNKKLLTVSEVCRMLGMSRRAFDRMVSAGGFPPPMRRNRRWVRWFLSDVNGWLSDLDAHRQRRPA